MKDQLRHKGVALLLTVFVVALLTAVVVGLLQLNTLEIQLMNNHACAAEALAIAEAGLNDAFAEIRVDSSWDDGFTDKAFAGGSYSVVVTGMSSSIYPDETDDFITIRALDVIFPGATLNFKASHPLLTDAEFDSRASLDVLAGSYLPDGITISPGSYFYSGTMNGSTFAVPIPLDATLVETKLKLKKSDYPQLPANVSSKSSYLLDGGGPSEYLAIVSEGTSARGFMSRVTALAQIGRTSPYTILINEMRINE